MRAADFGGRNPAKRNPLVGRPAALRTAAKAQAPGTGVTGSPERRQARTMRNPGSLMAGVPASLTKAIDFPAASCAVRRLAASCSL